MNKTNKSTNATNTPKSTKSTNTTNTPKSNKTTKSPHPSNQDDKLNMSNTPNNQEEDNDNELEESNNEVSSPTPKRQNNKRRNPLVVFLMIVLVLTAMFQIFGTQLMSDGSNNRKQIPISELTQLYNTGQLAEITVKTGEVWANTKTGEKLLAFKLPNENRTDLGFNNSKIDTKINVADIESDSFWGELMLSILPIFIIMIIIFIIMKKAGGASGGGFGFGSSKAKMFVKEDSSTKFADVAGCDEAKNELVEVVDFLKKPQKYLKMGAKIPKGTLLIGSPGTGKTLLARAIAGEASVPFFSISGSEFIEMFVGVGASRVRDLFSKAKKLAPAIIFIDEIDAIGKQRGNGYGGGHDEREQTLNQILTEMDGFENGTNVIVIAATNRPDVLDKALLRPGRFDRHVVIDKPDLKAREQILAVHAKNKPLSKNVILEDVARKTPGFSGAELESVMNEAAIAAAKKNKKSISPNDLFEAVEKVMMGPEKRSSSLIEQEKIITAYHEVGHALVSQFIPECDPVHKISIVARGMSLGSTWYLPNEERRMYSKSKFLAEICSLLGGRVAETIKFGDTEITTGASNDLQRATNIAKKMVMEYGMSSLGITVFHENEGYNFTGVDFVNRNQISEKTMQKIDEEVKLILEQCLTKTTKIISDHLDLFELITQELLKKEIILEADFKKFFTTI